MKVLFLADKPNWAYSSIAQAVQKYNADPEVQVKIDFIKGNEKKLKKKWKK